MTRIEFERTLLKTRSKMMRVATDFFHDEENAEDIVQEVYERMLRRGWHEDDNLEALLIRATKNLCVSVWRRQRLRETERLESIPEPVGHFTADMHLLQQEQCMSLENAIRQLPPSEQRLIRMKGDDLSLKEISEQTGIPKRSASAMLSTARKRLMDILKRRNDD